MFRPFALAILAALCLAVAVGCGSSDSKGQALSKSELIAQGDSICKASREQVAPVIGEIEKVQRPPISSDDRSELPELLRQGKGETEEEISQLRSLVPPASDVRVINNWLSKLETDVMLVDKGAESLERGDRGDAESQNERAKSESDSAHRIARSYGFRVCDTKG